jgi:tRNA dimethylallyltransferase
MIYFNEKTIIPIGGPTASGKSAVALEVAVGLEGDVVNADSLQLYKEIPILTAQPAQKEMEIAKHHLYGVYNYNESPSAGDWLGRVSGVVESDDSAGVLVTVGGTGLYLSSLMYGLSPIPEISDSVRFQVRQQGRTIVASSGEMALYACVVKKDPMIAGRIHPNHTQRLLRAWEVVEQTGRSIVYWQKEPRHKIENPRSPLFVLDLDRQSLHERIEKRCRQMVEVGVLDEIRQLLEITGGRSAPICKAIGFHEFKRHVDGECSLEDAINDVVVSTCQYAKRQQTWFRTQYQAGDIILIQNDTPQNQASMILKSLYSLSA